MSLHLMNIMHEEDIYCIVYVYEMLALCCILSKKVPSTLFFRYVKERP